MASSPAAERALSASTIVGALPAVSDVRAAEVRACEPVRARSSVSRPCPGPSSEPLAAALRALNAGCLPSHGGSGLSGGLAVKAEASGADGGSSGAAAGANWVREVGN